MGQEELHKKHWTFILLNSVDCVKLLPVGRGGATLLVATLMVVSGVLSSQSFYDAIACNLPLILLVFGTMIIAFLLEKQGHLISVIFWVVDRSSCPVFALVWLFLFNCCFTPFLGWDTTAIERHTSSSYAGSGGGELVLSPQRWPSVPTSARSSLQLAIQAMCWLPFIQCSSRRNYSNPYLLPLICWDSSDFMAV